MNLFRLALFAFLGAIVGTGLAVIAADALPPVYQAAFTVSPALSGAKSSSLSVDLPFGSDLLGDLGGAVGGGGPARANYERFLAVLSGRGLGDAIAASPELMHRMFANQWDAQQHRWHPPTGPTATVSAAIRRAFGLKSWAPPGPDDVLRFLDSHLVVTPMRKGSFHEVAAQSPNAKFALDLARFVLVRADATLRQHDLASSDFNVRYLREQLALNPVAEIRGPISQNLASEMLKGMQMRNPRPYTVEVFSAPALQSRPVFPNPVLMTLFGVVGGIVVGLLVAFLTAPGVRRISPVPVEAGPDA